MRKWWVKLLATIVLVIITFVLLRSELVVVYVIVDGNHPKNVSITIEDERIDTVAYPTHVVPTCFAFETESLISDFYFISENDTIDTKFCPALTSDLLLRMDDKGEFILEKRFFTPKFQ